MSPAGKKAKKAPSGVLAGVLLAIGAVVMASTIINVALPQIMRELSLTQGAAQWLSTVFLAVMTGAMTLTPWLTRRFGQRNLYLYGITVFCLATVLGGVSSSFPLLLVARMGQGAIAGILQPLAMTTLLGLFPPEKRGRAMGLYGLGVVLSPAIGPAVGGWLVDVWSWRSVFYLELPFMAIAWPLLARGLPREAPGEAIAFDWAGLGWMSASMTSAFAGLGLLESHGSPAWTVASFVLAALTLAGFLRRQARFPSPLLNLAIFRVPSFRAAFIVGLAYGMGVYGSTYLIPMLLEMEMGLSATSTGLIMTPGGLLLALVLPWSGRLADRYPGRKVLAAGFVLFIVSAALLALAHRGDSIWPVLLWTLVGRVGLGLIIPALNANAVRELSRDMVHDGTSAITFARLISGAFGIALLSLIVSWQGAFSAAFAVVAVLYVLALLSVRRM